MMWLFEKKNIKSQNCNGNSFSDMLQSATRRDKTNMTSSLMSLSVFFLGNPKEHNLKSEPHWLSLYD